MERSFVLCERPRSCSQRPMEMGCAYNEAQVRVTLFKKWIRRAQSQLGWTQVLQTLLSPPSFRRWSLLPLPEALRPRRREIRGFRRGKETGSKKNQIKVWRGDFWAPVRCHLPRTEPGKAASLGRAPLSSPGRAWDSAAQLIDSNESLYFL